MLNQAPRQEIPLQSLFTGVTYRFTKGFIASFQVCLKGHIREFEYSLCKMRQIPAPSSGMRLVRGVRAAV